MTKKELVALNIELVALLTTIREQTDDTLEELDAIDDDDCDAILESDDGD